MERSINASRADTGAVASTVTTVTVDAGHGNDVRNAIVRVALDSDTGAGSISVVIDTDALPLVITFATAVVDELRQAAVNLN